MLGSQLRADAARDAAARARQIAPYLDEQVIAVGRIDISRVDVKGLFAQLPDSIDRQMIAVSEGVVQQWCDAFRKAGFATLTYSSDAARRLREGLAFRLEPFGVLMFEGGEQQKFRMQQLKAALHSAEAAIAAARSELAAERARANQAEERIREGIGRLGALLEDEEQLYRKMNP